MAHVA